MLLREIQDNNLDNMSDFCGYELSDRKKEILKAVYDLVMKSNYLKPETRAFLEGKGSYRHCNNVAGASKNENTSRSRIYYDLSKLKKLLGEQLGTAVLQATDDELKRVEERVHKVMEKHREKSLLDGFSIKLPEPEIVEELTESEFKDLVAFIKLYSYKGIMRAEANISARQVGYLRYLEQSKVLSGIQKDDLEFAKKYLIK